MNYMDGIKTLNNPFDEEQIFKQKQELYSANFSIGTMTTEKFEDKIELLTLVCFLSNLMQTKKGPFEYPNTLKVLEKVIERKITSTTGEDNFLQGLSIVCDDLLYRVKDVPKPSGYTNASQIVDRIKELLSQWCPF